MALGKLYVTQYFPPENKQKILQLVHNLIVAYRYSIKRLTWMEPSTKAKAQAKLNHLMIKVAYPDKWRDYSTLVIKKDNLIGNIVHASQFNYNYAVSLLGKPVNRSLWQMTPQTINAYYNPEMNEIVFPAAILQPQFFDAKADMAVNYGGIGAVIGHEISHGFDDQGSHYDPFGNLHDWMTKKDHKQFKKLTNKLVAQYDAYEPIKGHHVNGKLTLGENIADNSGLAVANRAYQLSLKNKAAPILNGFTGNQRFYIGWAQVWRGKTRPKCLLMNLKVDPYSPEAVRGNAPLRNQDGFYKAFNVQSKDKMYLPPKDRVHIW